MINSLRNDLKKAANPQRAKASEYFFKTEKGGYAAGDKFYGLGVPLSRTFAKKYATLSLPELEDLLASPIHEERLIALLILVDQYKKADDKTKKAIYEFYLAHTKGINNWDLVDQSADKIVGEYVYKQNDMTVLRKLAKSHDLWEKRIAILSTFAFLRHGDTKPTFEIADILLHDIHDLIHKAVGWLIREAGKKVSIEEEEAFLKTRYKTMPRTMLRYAIERFPEPKRKSYLQGSV